MNTTATETPSLREMALKAHQHAAEQKRQQEAEALRQRINDTEHNLTLGMRWFLHRHLGININTTQDLEATFIRHSDGVPSTIHVEVDGVWLEGWTDTLEDMAWVKAYLPCATCGEFNLCDTNFFRRDGVFSSDVLERLGAWLEITSVTPPVCRFCRDKAKAQQ